MYRIILASESPRRKEIMATMGIPFECVPANVREHEVALEDLKPSEMVKKLSGLKARSVAGELAGRDEDLIIIGADTMVFFKEEALGKPKDKKDAERMLLMLSGNVHEVYTGVCIIIRKKVGTNKILSFAVHTRVTVAPLTIEQIRDYISTGEPMDKAGAYAIQGGFGIFIREIKGDYYNIVGFPISKIYEKLLVQGIDLKKL